MTINKIETVKNGIVTETIYEIYYESACDSAYPDQRLTDLQMNALISELKRQKLIK